MFSWQLNKAILATNGGRFTDLFKDSCYTHCWVQEFDTGKNKWEGSASNGGVNRKVQKFRTKQEAQDWVIAQLVTWRLDGAR